MTGTVSPSIPAVNSPDSTEEPKIPDALITLRDALNAILTSANIVDGSLISAASISTAKLADNAVTHAKIAANTIQAGDLAIGSVSALALAADSVTTTAIADGAVGTAELAADAVTGAKLADSSVNTSNIVGGAVTSARANLTGVSVQGTDIGSLGTSFTTAADLGVSTAGTWLVIGTVSYLYSGGSPTLQMGIHNGSADSAVLLETGAASSGGVPTVTIAHVVTATGSGNLLLRVKRNSSGFISVAGSGTRFCGLRIA